MLGSKLCAVALVLHACLLAACGDDRQDKPDQTERPSPAALYALTSNVWGPDGATGYLYSVESLTQGEPDLDQAIELAGGAWLTARKGSSSVYVSSGEGGPTITRWDVAEDGRFEEGPSISFERLGLESGIRFGTAPIVSETKAYLLDSDQQRLATWNPKSMSIGKQIELDLPDRDGLRAWTPTIVARGKTLFVTAVWEDDWRFAKSSRVIAIDIETDAIVNTWDEPRCEQLAVASRASDGTAYYSPYAHASAARTVLGSEFGSRACALRIVPPDGSLDESWEVDLSSLAGGRAAGEFVLASDEVGFFRAFYPREIGVAKDNWEDKQGAAAYRWWRWEIGADAAEEVPDQPLTVEAAHYVVDEKTYVGNPSDDWSETDIVELREDGELRKGITVSGTPGGLFRVH